MEHDAAPLAAAAPAEPLGEAAGVRVTGVSDDTRTLEPGDLFLLRGSGPADAERLAAAAAGGAAAALLPPGCDVAAGLPLFRMAKGRPLDQAAAGRVADAFFGRPADGLSLVGVTGTNGKTTVATLTRHLLDRLGLRCGLLGTVAVDTGTGPRPATLTTPGAIELRRHFAAMREAGLAAAAIEASSHALDQGRTAGLSFAVAVFTNLTRDHLDYHGTMAAYADAKARLFTQLAADGRAVVNADDPAADRFAGEVPQDRVLRTSVADAAGADANAEVTSLTATSAAASFRGPWGSFDATLATGGLHNVSNALQAVAAAWSVASGRSPGVATPEALAAALASAPPVPGRLEPVAPPAGSDAAAFPGVLVDYAHTPDALERVLAALRPATAGRLIVVYGCGGDRDRTKRPLMTAAALAGADAAVLTSDNPRTEDPQKIIDDAAAGVAAADRGRLSIEPDRRAAILAAVRGADAGDTVLIAGKGHEDYQLVPDGAGGIRRLHFDDREEAAAALRNPS